MSVWLDTRGNTVLSIAICDRCKMKRAYSDISMDRNTPGLRVCNNGCNDERDPYRLPARRTLWQVDYFLTRASTTGIISTNDADLPAAQEMFAQLGIIAADRSTDLLTP